MTIEQTSELNRFVDSSIPLTWTWRWNQFKRILPLLVFSMVCMLEMGLFKAWLGDRLTSGFVLMLLAICFSLPVFFLGMAEILIRIQQRSRRVIRFIHNKIIVKPAKNQVIQWKNVHKFQIEPIPGEPGLTILKLFLKGRQKKHLPKRVYWEMVLKSPAQTEELVRYLQRRKAETPTDYEIEILNHPAAMASQAPFPLLGMSLYLSGFYFLLHGVPMLWAILNHGHRRSGENSKLTEQEIAKLGRFITEHFATWEEFNNVFVAICASLLIAGVAMLIVGWRLMIRKPPEENASGNA